MAPVTRITIASVMIFIWTLQVALGQEDGIEYFERKIRPVLHRECLSCHHSGKSSGSLSLDSRAGWTRGGDSGPAVIPGDPRKSLLIRAIRHEADGLEMPEKAPKLNADDIAAFERWIQMGAPDPRDTPEPLTTSASLDWAEIANERAKWWCWQPLRTNDAVKHGQRAIDHWVDQGIQAAGLVSSEIADRRTLIRRLSFQLCGLPPTQAEVDRFLNDHASGAWERCVDHFLSKPDFGIHWARHWMDVVRYAETHGSEDDALLPFSYRYRDYLIRALQTDIPFNQMIREHLAGDLIPPRWNQQLEINEALIGTAFLRFVEFNQTPVDVKREEIIVIDNQIDAIGKAFQGITISCARCHDHKFDPISDEDFYALYGILRSTRTAMRVIDDPAVFDRDRERLLELQSKIRHKISAIWIAQTSQWAGELQSARSWCRDNWKSNSKWDDLQKSLPAHSWTRAMADALCNPKQNELNQIARVLMADDSEFTRQLDEVVREMTDRMQRSEAAITKTPVLFDLTTGELPGWQVVGVGLADHASSHAGGWGILGGRSQPFARVLERGFHSNVVSDRHGGSLRSPDFILDQDAVSLLARGDGQAKARLVIENFQGDSLLFESVNPKLDSAIFRWVTMPIKPQWRGLRAHLELLTRDDKPYVGVTKDPKALEKSDGRSSFGLAKVVKHNHNQRPIDSPAIAAKFFPTQSKDRQPIESRDQWLDLLSELVGQAIGRIGEGTASDDDARLITTLMKASVLAVESNSDGDFAQLTDEYRRLEQAIPIARRSPGVHEDACAVNQPFLPRGEHRQPQSDVPRRYLTVLGSKTEAYQGNESGRLRLAEEIASEQNPLTARVYVNRVWHWLFGRGIVPTVDNFGRMGEPPSHPELLDQLAAEFMRDGWSTKKLIRTILLSNCWQRSSAPTESAKLSDPSNRLWTHASVRRLDAESIRDTILFVAGTLRQTDSGLGTLNYYHSVQEPNKQSPPGPIDGDGRRSIFLEVRRNFPNEFLLSFDFPRPASPAGRRSQATVPNQSLTLMNDPFVIQQSHKWSHRVLQAQASTADRINQFYLDLLNRNPSVDELQRAKDLINAASERRAEEAGWDVLAHAMLNLKEAIYLP